MIKAVYLVDFYYSVQSKKNLCSNLTEVSAPQSMPKPFSGPLHPSGPHTPRTSDRYIDLMRAARAALLESFQ